MLFRSIESVDWNKKMIVLRKGGSFIRSEKFKGWEYWYEAALIMSDSGFTWYGLLAAYIGLPIAVALWLGYKLVRGSRPVPPAELDLSADDVR